MSTEQLVCLMVAILYAGNHLDTVDECLKKSGYIVRAVCAVFAAQEKK